MKNHLFNKTNHYYFKIRHDIIALVSKTNGIILEIGCGAGVTGATLREQGKASKLVGIEIEPEMARIAQKSLDLVVCGDIEEIDIPEKYGRYDYIICGDVLEHLRNPWQVMHKLRSYLKANGIVIASIPNIRFWRIIIDLLIKGEWIYKEDGILDKEHLRFFTKKSIKSMFKGEGFEIIDIKPYFLGSKTVVFNKITFGFLLDFLATRYIIKAQMKGKAE